jgi:hypothetical protein
MERAKGFEPSTLDLESIANQKLPKTNNCDYTQIRAQIASANGPELAQIVASWPKLSAPLKAAILAIVNSVGGGQ